MNVDTWLSSLDESYQLVLQCDILEDNEDQSSSEESPHSFRKRGHDLTRAESHASNTRGGFIGDAGRRKRADENWQLKKANSSNQRSFRMSMGIKNEVNLLKDQIHSDTTTNVELPPPKSIKADKERASFMIQASDASGVVPTIHQAITPRKKKSSREYKILLTVIEADELPKESVLSTFCTVHFVSKSLFQTKTKYNSVHPLWHETFEINIPIRKNTLQIRLWNVITPTRQELLGSGSMTINEESENEEKSVSVELTLNGANRGRVQLKYTMIEVDHNSSSFVSLLLSDLVLVNQTYRVLERMNFESAALSFVELLYSTESVNFLSYLVSRPENREFLLSKTSILRRMFAVFCKYARATYIEQYLQPIVRSIDNNQTSYEVRYSKISQTSLTNSDQEISIIRDVTDTSTDQHVNNSTNDTSVDIFNNIIQVNREALQKKIEEILDVLLKSILDLPENVKSLLKQIYNTINSESEDTVREVMGDFLFHKFLCPPIASPFNHGLISENDSTYLVKDAQSFIVLAKVLTNLSMRRLFPLDNELSIMNEFILSQTSKIDRIYGIIASSMRGVENICHSTRLRNLFGEYLIQKRAEEGLEFWEDALRYKMLSTQTDRRAFSQMIYRLYITDDSEREVNIDCEVKKQIATELEHAKLDLFDSAIDQVQHQLEISYLSFQIPSKRKTIIRAGQQIIGNARSQCLIDICKFYLENMGMLQEIAQELEGTENDFAFSLVELNRVLGNLSFEYNPFKGLSILKDRKSVV